MVPHSECLEYKFTCPLPNGLHARPANLLEQVVSEFRSTISLLNLSNNKVANTRSVLSMVGADIKEGDECIIKVSGEDKETAYKELVRFIKNELSGCDDALPETAVVGDLYIPPVLAAADVSFYTGMPVVAGFGRGKVVHVEALKLPANIAGSTVDDPDTEIALLKDAVTRLQAEISVKLKSPAVSAMEKEILGAQYSIAADEELVKFACDRISGSAVNAGTALLNAFEHFSAILRDACSELIRERIVDLQDVCSQLLKMLYGSCGSDKIVLDGPSVCVAENLTPSQFISMDKTHLKALATVNGSSTSHVVILARSYGIPTLVGVKDACVGLSSGQEVFVDANYGLLVYEINEKVERFFALEDRMQSCHEEHLSAYVDKTASSADGFTLKVVANIALAAEVEAAMARGAEGVGLFRTEMLFMDRSDVPSEEEHFAEYKAAAEAADGKPVTIRTFDIGGDKEVACLDLVSEENPFLGYRGVRIYQEYETVFKSQVRAILRASAFGKLKIMIPMVTCVDEVIYVKGVLDSVMEELSAESVTFDADIELGVNIEVPSAAFIIPQLAEYVSFVSLGTNDLTQYFLAVDRGNKQVSSLYQNRHPGFLWLVNNIVEQAHSCSLKVSMCGEMAGQLENLPLLLATGIDELSVAAPAILPIKAAVGEYETSLCRDMLDKALKAKTVKHVNDILSEFSTQNSEKPVIQVSLVDLDADCINKPEVIKYVCNVLFCDRRAANAIDLEKDFWRREAVYSTGLGHGIAVPHCKTSFIKCNSICVLRLKQPVEWESLDGEPVDMIFGMTIKDVEQAGNAHMRIFSKLARNIMHEEFRDTIRNLGSEQAIVEYLFEKLELA